MISLKIGGLIVAAFIAGAFVASPELRAYAANTVGSTDIIDGQVKTADLANNVVTAAKIKDGEVKAAEIAADAVGGSEIAGVSKLLVGRCVLSDEEAILGGPANSFEQVDCTINGVTTGDNVLAEVNLTNACYQVAKTLTNTNTVFVLLMNHCTSEQTVGAGTIGIVVFAK